MCRPHENQENLRYLIFSSPFLWFGNNVWWLVDAVFLVWLHAQRLSVDVFLFSFEGTDTGALKALVHRIFFSVSICFAQIRAHPSVAGHTLYDLENVQRTSSTEPTLILVDTAGYDFLAYLPTPFMLLAAKAL